jgi:hypothetical protein
MSKIEDVARAIYEARLGYIPPWEDLADGDWPLENARNQARAALTALETPTEEMLVAGAGAACAASNNNRSYDQEASLTWQAMLQAILKEGK